MPGLGCHLVGEVDRDGAAQSVLEIGAKGGKAAGNALDQKVEPPWAGRGRPPANPVDLMLIGHPEDGLAACEHQLFHASPARRPVPSQGSAWHVQAQPRIAWEERVDR